MVVFQNYALLPGGLLLKTSTSPLTQLTQQVEAEDSNRAGASGNGGTSGRCRQPPQLSGGMKQRVSIARALAIRPKVLILDEPFGALDAITKEELQEELLKIWNDHRCTVLMITHDIDEALFLCRLVMMTNGPAAKIGEVMQIPFRVRAIAIGLWKIRNTTSCGTTLPSTTALLDDVD